MIGVGKTEGSRGPIISSGLERPIKHYRRAYRKWGIEAQLDMVIEEGAELTKEICKAHRKGLIHVQAEVAEELVDLEIMVEQLKVILSDHLHSFDGMYMTGCCNNKMGT